MKTLLHVGCGAHRIDQTTSGFIKGGWKELRFDINELNFPDLLGSMTDMSTVSSQSVDAIFSSHNIEHLYIHEVTIALSEFKRVLKPDGFAIITCPDLQSVCTLVSQNRLMEPAYNSSAGPITPLDILYGHGMSIANGNPYMAHRCGFTESSLSTVLNRAGFLAVATMQRPNKFDLWSIASKSRRSEEEIRILAQEHFPR